VLKIASALDEDVRDLKQRMSSAWRHLADPALTSFDRRETRNYMKEAELALAAGLKRMADRERATRDAEVASNTNKRLDFRIFHLDP
jgi:hypothetical protein